MYISHDFNLYALLILKCQSDFVLTFNHMWGLTEIAVSLLPSGFNYFNYLHELRFIAMLVT